MPQATPLDLPVECARIAWRKADMRSCSTRLPQDPARDLRPAFAQRPLANVKVHMSPWYRRPPDCAFGRAEQPLSRIRLPRRGNVLCVPSEKICRAADTAQRQATPKSDEIAFRNRRNPNCSINC